MAQNVHAVLIRHGFDVSGCVKICSNIRYISEQTIPTFFMMCPSMRDLRFSYQCCWIFKSFGMPYCLTGHLQRNLMPSFSVSSSPRITATLGELLEPMMKTLQSLEAKEITIWQTVTLEKTLIFGLTWFENWSLVQNQCSEMNKAYISLRSNERILNAMWG